MAMTFYEMKEQIWTATGKSTELDPVPTSPNYDVSYQGGPYLNFVVNEAQRQVAKWKDKATGKPVRIHNLLSSFHYAAYYLEDTLVTVQNDSDPYYVTLTDSGPDDGQYEGWVLEVTSGDGDGQIRYIYRYDGATQTAYLTEAFDTEPEVGDTVKLYKRFEMLLPNAHAWSAAHIALPETTDRSRSTGNLLEVLSIVDVVNRRELVPAVGKEKFEGNLTAVGTPTEWFRYGNRIYYDVNVDEMIKYEVEYYRMPMNMTLDTEYPELPEVWHEAMVLWGVWHIFKRKMEATLAYAAKMDFEDEMRKTIGAFDVQKERVDLSAFVEYS
jgi:hypothetical protein